MKKFFVILTTQRSGSTFLRAWLNNHPDIRCHEEVFLPKYEDVESFTSYLGSKPRGGKIVKELLEKNRTSLFPVGFYFSQYMRQMLSSKPRCLSYDEVWQASPNRPFAKSCDATWVGYKLMYNQVDIIPSLLDFHLKHVDKCIHLVRKNVLDIVLSKAMAEKTGVWHSKNDAKTSRICIDPEMAIQECKKIVQAQQKFSDIANKLGALTVSYEDFFDESKQSGEMNKILEYLELDAEVNIKEVNLRKVINKPVQEVIENFMEVKEKLLASGIDSTRLGG